MMRVYTKYIRTDRRKPKGFFTFYLLPFTSLLSCLSCFLFLSVSLISAQSGGTFEIRKSVIANGGGSASGGMFSLDSTIAEPVAGTVSSGGHFSLTGGYRAGSAPVTAQNFAVFDFDGDGRTDASVFRPNPTNLLDNPAPEGSSSQWWLLRSSDQGTLGLTFGFPTDQLVPADFTGDGKADIAFFRPSTGQWFVLRSEDLTFFAFPFGASGDIAAPGDFDGDGTADPAVFRPSSGTWFIFRSSDQQISSIPFGVSVDRPIVADYDGGGKADVAVFRTTDNKIWLLRSTLGVKAYQFSSPGDRTAVGDWTGDGKADVAFYRPSDSSWFVIRSEDDSFFSFPWGVSGDIPVPGDYDGDSRTDPAIWRPSDRTWYIFGSTNGFEAINFGATGDVPLPSSVSVN